MSAKLHEVPDKPLSEYTEDDARLFRSPSVEDHLWQMKRALALATVLHSTLARVEDADFGHHENLTRDAASVVGQLCEDAWGCAEQLTSGMAGEIQNLRVVADVADEEGGAE
jgi:hypothetical protein